MTTDETAIIVLSDPDSGSEESLGRLFNALAAARDFLHQGSDVTILFQGTGTRWLGKLDDEQHPAHALFQSVREHVAGASAACSAVFGSAAAVREAGFELVRGNDVPGTDGLPSLKNLSDRGYRLLTF